MTVSFTDNQNSKRILNLQKVNQITYDSGKRYFMVHFDNDTETFTFSDQSYRDRIISHIRSVMQVKDLDEA